MYTKIVFWSANDVTGSSDSHQKKKNNKKQYTGNVSKLHLLIKMMWYDQKLQNDF